MFSGQRGGAMWNNNQTVGGCSMRSGQWQKVAESRGGDPIDGPCTNGMHKIIYQETRSSAPMECSIDGHSERYRNV